MSVTHLSDLHAGKLGLTGLVGEGCSCFSIVSLTSSWWMEGREEKGRNHYMHNTALKPSRTKRNAIAIHSWLPRYGLTLGWTPESCEPGVNLIPQMRWCREQPAPSSSLAIFKHFSHKSWPYGDSAQSHIRVFLLCFLFPLSPQVCFPQYSRQWQADFT